LIEFKRSDMLHDPTKTCGHRASSEAHSARPQTGPRSQKRLDWHTCMPPVDWLHRRPRASPAFITRPSPPGLAALQTVRGEPRFSNPHTDPPPSLLRKAHPSVSRTLTECLRALTEPPGSTEHLRVFTSAPGRSPADHPTRPDPSGPTCTTCG